MLKLESRKDNELFFAEKMNTQRENEIDRFEWDKQRTVCFLV